MERMQRIKPVTGEIYHIYNRGVEKRSTFLDDKDRFRFIHDLFEFNDEAPVKNLTYYIGRNKSKEVGLHKRLPRKLLIELLALCVMPNHFHLLVRQKVDGGVTEFMRKLGPGYTNYFNQKYSRVGSLFQGKYKLIQLTEESHFIHLPYYIHFNPLDLKTPEWREGKLKDPTTAIKFLGEYRWSSHLDYLGKKNFPSVTQRDFLLEFFGGTKGYEDKIKNWLKDLGFDSINELALES